MVWSTALEINNCSMPVRAVSVVRVVVQPTEINRIDAIIAVYEYFMMFSEDSRERSVIFSRRELVRTGKHVPCYTIALNTSFYSAS